MHETRDILAQIFDDVLGVIQESLEHVVSCFEFMWMKMQGCSWMEELLHQPTMLAPKRCLSTTMAAI